MRVRREEGVVGDGYRRIDLWRLFADMHGAFNAYSTKLMNDKELLLRFVKRF